MSHSLAGKLADTLADGGWRSKARPSQLPPSGDWRGWIIKAGRGFGKGWAGANFTNELAEAGTASRIALIAATAADARDVMVEGESGILRLAPSWFRPTYEPSKRRIEWPNGATAHTFSAEEADRLRGPQFDFGWCDEFAAWQNVQATWDMFQFGLRLGKLPRFVITTTPRPLKLLKELMAMPDVVTTSGSTFENADNLAPSFLKSIRDRYEGTRLGRQELNAELLEDVQGALWTRDMIEKARFTGAVPNLKRVVVAIDPSGTGGENDGGDAVGVVVAGLGMDGLGYVLADRTLKASPAAWGAAAVAAYQEFRADRIVAERNFGGSMVEHVIRTVNPSTPYREVTASRGKIQRAEPIAALYEQNRVRHVGSLTELEDQLAAMTGDGYLGDGSPDRADALVWALTELMTRPQAPGASMGFYRLGGDPEQRKSNIADGLITSGPLAGGFATRM
ncbi:terminase family protein [Bradyrhizobium sp. WYCCWR 13022]|uniref:DNA-packaging protein n=1 Tax=unclassified Bradyrhizobium TaxID=2631580 RepID=UPI00263B8D2D|nr:terminase family protein [Bradyrhizobium sp. WYCCWR 13022]MDN4988836.1 terminase family protein [Bradyrhizobium sp. WYCCWR 13022]